MYESLWTKSNARLQISKNTSGKNLNWLFLPGGPGLGSESLLPLIDILSLPGKIWRLDLPGDGSNTQNNREYNFSLWFDALIEAVSALDNVILVAHSTGGMYALATESLSNKLKGLVLMNSAPDYSWRNSFADYVNSHPILQMIELHEHYSQNPSNELLKQLTILSKPYLFTEEGMSKDLTFLNNLPYNYLSCEWSDKNFDDQYKSAWIPNNLPTLIFSGDQDKITPLELFKCNSSFNHPMITMKTITRAGHFPWIEQPTEVMELFNQYAQQFT